MSEEPQVPQMDEQGPEQQAPELPENKVLVEDAGTLKKKVTVTVARERINAKLDEMFGELSRTAQVPGFRVGHAPRRLIEKRFGREVSQDVRNAVIGESLGQAIDKSGLKTIGEPDLDLEKIELPEQGELAFSFEVEVMPEFELPQLKGITVNRPKIEITPERVDQQIAQWREIRARYEPTDGSAAANDVVTADVKVTGAEISTVHQSGKQFRVAAGQVEGIPIVDLGKELEGKKAGESATVTVTVPEAHPNEAWRGKQATVELSITEVRGRVLPELDDAFAQELGFDSIEQLRQQVCRGMENRLELEARQAMRSQVEQYLLDNIKMDLPAGVAARHADRVLSRRYVDLLYRGVPRERIDERLTELQAAAAQEAQRGLTLRFILNKVAEQEGVAVSEDEVNARVAEMAAQYERRPERLRQELDSEGRLGEVEIALKEEKALDKLVEQAKVVEQAPEEPSAEESKEKAGQ